MRARIGVTVLALVAAACSTSATTEPSATSRPASSPAAATGPPAPTTTTAAPSTTTAPPEPAVAFAGTAPALVFVAGTLWDVSAAPATTVAELPGNRSQGYSVATPYGIVVALASETEPGLWLIDQERGAGSRLTSAVGSFAVAADNETVAWAEHLGEIGAPGSQTRLVEASLPDLDERASATLDGFARVAGYAGDLVVLETSDGESAVVSVWVPATGAVAPADGYAWVLGTNPVEPSAALATQNADARWVVVLSDGHVLPEASDAVDQPWDFAESGRVAFSPDGSTMATAGSEPVLVLRNVSDRAEIARIELGGVPGAFFSTTQVVWRTADSLLVLAETWDVRSESDPHSGWRFIFECSSSAASCEPSVEIVYEPQDFDEVGLIDRFRPEPTASQPPLPGWRRVDVDAAVFGDAAPVAAQGEQGIVAIAGCHRSSPAAWFPLWVSVDGETWERAEGPAEPCLAGLVQTQFGWVTWGRQGAYVSADARAWQPLEGPWGDDPGWTQFVASDLIVTTVLRSRAAEAESTVASLWTTLDGETWESHPEDAALFDSANVAKVIQGGPGFIAVGASPGGEFVPTAAVWTSADGSDWKLASPRGAGFADATIFDVAIAGPGYVAVGTDWDSAAFWASEDGTTWTRRTGTNEASPEFGHLVAEDITVSAGTVFSAGFIWDAEAPSPQPRLWMSLEGRDWEPAPYSEYAGRLPFGVTAFEKEGGIDLGLAFWPPPSPTSDSPVILFLTE